MLEICQQLNVFEACEKVSLVAEGTPLDSACPSQTLEELCGLIPKLPVDSSIAPSSPTLQFSSDASHIREEQEDPSALPPAPPLSPRQHHVQAIEKAARSSVLGCVLQPLLAVISAPSTCTLQMANTMQRNLSRLAELSAKVRVCTVRQVESMCGRSTIWRRQEAIVYVVLWVWPDSERQGKRGGGT